MMLSQMATWTGCGLILASARLHTTGGPWPRSSPSVLRMAHKGPVGCVSLYPRCRHRQKGNMLSPSYCSCHKWGPKDLADPFCTPQVSLADVCVSCPLSMSTTTPTFPQSWCWDTQFPVRGGTILHTRSSAVCEFSSILTTTYLEIESNFKVMIQPQETALHFRCQLQTQVLPVFVTNWLQTRGL